MKAMILAAGRGKRMGLLTEKIPKPLLEVAGKPLIEWQIIRLREAGFVELVINLGYLGEQIQAHLRDGAQLGVKIAYSVEPQAGLETGGGVFQALPLLGDAPFLLTNADVFCDYPYQQLSEKNTQGVHLVLVDTPAFKATGDFSLSESGRLMRGGDLTFAGISVVNPQIFAGAEAGVFPIAPFFYETIVQQTATAEYYQGIWQDVGTPERLAQINEWAMRME